jgi:hypothetical protein
MCAWIVTAYGDLNTGVEPRFDSRFNQHMNGESSSDKSEPHTGLHSLNSRLEDKDSYKISGNTVLDGQCPEIYSTKVRIKNREKSDKAGYGAEKLSSFFPDDMTLDEIRQAVVYAWQSHRTRASGYVRLKRHKMHDPTYPSSARENAIHSHRCNLTDLKVGLMLTTKWAGQVEIAKSRESWAIWIGSPQMGTDSSPLLTAYPAVGGKFF